MTVTNRPAFPSRHLRCFKVIHPRISELMLGLLVCFTHQCLPKAAAQELPENLRTENLVAWCIVPFDAEKRGSEARAKMLQELGLKKLAYDWREEHVPTWDDELKALTEANVELTAFWCSSSLEPSKHPGNLRIFEFLKKNKVQTQLWFMLPTGALDRIEDPKERLNASSKAVRDLAEAAAELGCSVGLYNHGGWPGKPSTLVAIMKELQDLENVGLVYNFHHAHEDLAEFPEALKIMRPYLMCLNLNGMTVGGAKILPLAEGKLDQKILQWILDVNYQGPIGILDHRNELDARESLQQNLIGLQKVWMQLQSK